MPLEDFIDLGKANSSINAGAYHISSNAFPNSPSPKQTPHFSVEYKSEGLGDEVERGCQYFVKAKVAHNATHFGLIEAPRTDQFERGFKIRSVVPLYAIKPDYLEILKEENGVLIDVGNEKGTLTHFRVNWKDIVQVFYSNPICQRDDKEIPLEEFFSVIKVFPREQSKPQREPEIYFE